MFELQNLQDFFSNPFVRGGAIVLLAILLAWGGSRAARAIIQRRVHDSDARYHASKVVNVVAYVVVVLAVIAEVGWGTTGLPVALGVMSAGVAFALQEVIASFAGWVALAVGGFYRVGDRIQLGGIKGDVIDIGFVRTTVMEIGGWVDGDLYSGRIVRIANSFVFKEPVFNYSGEFEFVWDEIVLPIKYGSDYARARELMETAANEVVGAFVGPAKQQWAELLKGYRLEDARVEPFVSMTANDNWLAYTIRYVVEYKKRRTTKDKLFALVLERIEGTEGRVGIASTTVRLLDAPPLAVELSSARIGERASAPTSTMERGTRVPSRDS